MTIKDVMERTLQLMELYSEGGQVIESDDPRIADIKDEMIFLINVGYRLLDEANDNAEFKADVNDELDLPDDAVMLIPFFAAGFMMDDTDDGKRYMAFFDRMRKELLDEENYRYIKIGLFGKKG